MSADPNPIRDSLPGRVLRGSGTVTYHVRDLLGEGGQGWVFRAHWDGPEGALVIVKVLRPDVVTDDSLLRFQREAQVLRMLSQQTNPCPNVVRFFDHAQTEVASSDGKRTLSLPFTVLEYVRGTTLERVLGLQPGRGLAVERTRRIIRHAVTALESVHAKGVIHRDFKPSNVLLSGEGVEELAKVTDFGLAKVVDADFGRTKKVAGASIGYAPPEQYERGNARISCRSDVFSLASVAYEMLVGAPAYPFGPNENPLIVITRILQDSRPSLRKTKGKLSAELAKKDSLISALDAVLAKGLDADPDKRWDTPTHFLTELDAILRDAAMPAATMSGRIGQGAVIASVPPSETIPTTRESLQGLESVPGNAAPTPNVASRKNLEGTVPIRKPPSGDGRYQWTMARAPGLGARTFYAGVLSHDGRRAFALSGSGLYWLSPTGAGMLSLPSSVPVTAWNGLTVTASSQILVFGKDGVVALVDPDEASAPLLLPTGNEAISFLGASSRGDHIYLVGATTEEGRAPRGVISHFWERSLVRTHRTKTPCTLRACASVKEGEIYACGDTGVLTILRGEDFTPIESPCVARLSAIASTNSGLFVVGEGGHILRIEGTRANLEPAGTQQDLLCIDASEGPAVWVGAGEGRILQHVPGHGFPRANRGVVHAGAVLHIWSRQRTVRAFTSDGSILLGTHS